MSQLLEQAESLQSLMLAHATGEKQDESEYRELRKLFRSDPALDDLLPSFVRTCRSLAQFWEYIKRRSNNYAGRRELIYTGFQPLLDYLEVGGTPPSDEAVSEALGALDLSHISSVWAKALERRQADPEGAITAARTLLESVCKCILDNLDVEYEDAWDLPKLYKTTAETLNLAPSQHTEQVFKQILGGCVAVVEGLGSLRNKLSDAHGRGKLPVKPAARHAELVVNLAGAAASFLVETYRARQEFEA